MRALLETFQGLLLEMFYKECYQLKFTTCAQVYSSLRKFEVHLCNQCTCIDSHFWHIWCSIIIIEVLLLTRIYGMLLTPQSDTSGLPVKVVNISQFNKTKEQDSEKLKDRMIRIREYTQRELTKSLTVKASLRHATEDQIQEQLQKSDIHTKNIELSLADVRIRLEESEARCQQAKVRVQEAETASRESQTRAREAIERSERRCEEMTQQITTSHERERIAEQRIRDIQQQTTERIRLTEETSAARVQEVEVRAQAAERRLHDAQERARTAERRLHDTELQAAAAESRLHVAEQRARESRIVPQADDQHWIISREELGITEEEVGRGGWAVIKVAVFRGTRVAAKCFYQDILVSHYNRQLFNREMNIAARLRHPNLVQFIGASFDGEPIIVTELMSTSLRKVLERGPIEPVQIKSISLDILQALNYLHLMQPQPIIHRDISSANVLLDPLPDNCWRAKVSDYGSVNLLQHVQTVGPGSPTYAAPEASTPALQSPKMDIFSFGILLIEMLTDQFPEVDERVNLLESVNNIAYKTLIKQCLTEARNYRPSAEEAITKLIAI